MKQHVDIYFSHYDQKRKYEYVRITNMLSGKDEETLMKQAIVNADSKPFKPILKDLTK
jgi:hypothetical protein